MQITVSLAQRVCLGSSEVRPKNLHFNKYPMFFLLEEYTRAVVLNLGCLSETPWGAFKIPMLRLYSNPIKSYSLETGRRPQHLFKCSRWFNEATVSENPCPKEISLNSRGSQNWLSESLWLPESPTGSQAFPQTYWIQISKERGL